jgi:hypothetical protein
MNNYGTKLAEKFAKRALKHYYENEVGLKITNQEYEGEIKDKASVVNILTIKAPTIKQYNGSVSYETLKESNAQLNTNQADYYAFKVNDLDELKSYIKNPQAGAIENALSEEGEVKDAYILGAQVAAAGAGNRIGTDYTTGTVAVAATTGVVTGTGTTFTSAMVGLPFTCAGLVDAAGRPVWYRVKAFTSSTSITIEDDSDDETSAYTGGAISAGASYTIQGASAIQATDSNIYRLLTTAYRKLNEAKAPKSGRFVVVHPAIEAILANSNKLTQPVESQVRDVINNAYIGRVAGFDVYTSNAVSGNDTDGYDCVFGHKVATTFASSFTKTEVIEKLENDFGVGYRGIEVYGAKVPDMYKKFLGVIKASI